MSELPKGWAEGTIEDVLGILPSGKQLDQGWSPRCENFPSASEETWGALKTTAIQDGWFEAEHTKQLPDHLDPKPELEVKPGDVLLTCAGPRVRCGVICRIDDVRRKLFISGKMYRFRPDERIVEPDYLMALLRSPDQKKAIDQIKTGGSESGLNLTQARFKALTVPFPPLREQRRIVRKLDTLSARTSTARTHLTAIAKLVERYKSGVLLAAFRGQLTSDLRERTTDSIQVTINDPFTHTQIAPPSWTQHVFSEVCRIVGGSQPPKSTFIYAPQEGYIRLVQIRDYKSDAKATYIPSDLARRFCSPSDIMIGRYGPPIFQILRGIKGAYNVALMKAEPTEAVEQEFLYWYLHHPILFRYVEIDSKRTAGQDGVNKAHLERWPILLPPLDEQREIVRRIETAFAKIDRLAAEAEKALKLTDRLDQRILAKAFAGELVAQDPTDEPATELLARIREARATAPKPKWGRRKKTTA